ncbi:FtsX-like permease family protein [Actinosynnema sp. NPDC020468]|uniref:ABC transporter permease n=1 Tax=Actinosynnema sp. NPDC020468 TaxID=3154488 RepID=UPI0033DD0CE0
MLRTTLTGIRARSGRLVRSSAAIVLGVAFVTGTLVLGDATQAGLRDGYARKARNVDVSITAAPGRSDNPLDRAVLDAVRRVPGVAAAEGRETSTLPLVDPAGKAKDALGVALPGDDPLRPFDLVQGRYPATDDEVALDADTARKYALGQHVTVLGQGDRTRELTLVGVVRPVVAGGELSDGSQLVVLPSALHALDRDRGYREIVARAEPGVGQRRVADAVRGALDRAGLTVRTGEESIDDLVRQTAPDAAAYTGFLGAFAVVALLVAAMVITNTFTILVSHRTRELALLRCVGAGRGQIFAGVLAEAVVVGLVGSVLGLAGGLGLAALLQEVIGSFGRGGEIPVYTPVGARTVLAAFAVGVLVTVCAAVPPARRATRVPPVAALRSPFESGAIGTRIGRARVVVSVALLGLGAGAAALSFAVGADDRVAVAGLASAVLLCAALAAGPILVGPVTAVLGAVARPVFGVPARLATANARRNPKRTAATSAALMIGLTAVTLVTVVAAGAESSTQRAIDRQFPYDCAVSSAIFDRPLPADLADRLGALPEVRMAAAQATFTASVGGQGAQFDAVRGDAIGTLVRPALVAGRLEGLAPGEIAISDEMVGWTGLALGDTVSTSAYGGDRVPVDLKVVAVFSSRSFAMSSGLTTLDTMALLKPAETLSGRVLVGFRPGVPAADGVAAVERVTATSPLAEVESAAARRERVSGNADRTLGFVRALIGLATLIALFGIANTLSLSVLERTRESALARALGLSRGRLRAALVIESTLMALMGAAIGVAHGLVSAWLLVDALSTEAAPLDLTVPAGRLGVLVAIAVAAALVAAAAPSLRSARTSIVAGMREV